MGNKVYGVDVEGPITPLMVRDAISQCFFEAHCAEAEIGVEDQDINQTYCRELVRKMFTESGGDFEHPTREAILMVIDKLAEFSRNFRNQDLVKKHYGEIMELINKMK